MSMTLLSFRNIVVNTFYVLTTMFRNSYVAPYRGMINKIPENVT